MKLTRMISLLLFMSMCNSINTAAQANNSLYSIKNKRDSIVLNEKILVLYDTVFWPKDGGVWLAEIPNRQDSANIIFNNYFNNSLIKLVINNKYSYSKIIKYDPDMDSSTQPLTITIPKTKKMNIQVSINNKLYHPQIVFDKNFCEVHVFGEENLINWIYVNKTSMYE